MWPMKFDRNQEYALYTIPCLAHSSCTMACAGAYRLCAMQGKRWCSICRLR